jgi:hypothetical protein
VLQKQQQHNNNNSNNNNNHNDNDNNNNNQKKKNKNKNKNKKQHKNATKRCVTSCGMKSTSCFALHLRTRTERMNNTNAHTTIHNPYGIAGVRSSTIHEKVNIIIYTLI